ncbi:hypothetical protein TOT_020000322 [Theileria orientalis strain Shintoku]|uniref:Uncharacterized protein n=1 Tax=Theileria orientalis strain Shintoku TaxID=869250 RepID=J4D7A1_THEOR|nr:hypothetical protein TOT_020000322 [Theileria orientalis strain Shintoku]PVC51161.1 hypothetical protein MACL_00001780 [Theileria orientalis]BAM40055.1 hypothetical protein TOT_020000322 [Theileria orientalis strain Shintoku]|eukprot:XP_009690356.1 hypothetical protein TOT_020000322 [Theileria orientalis strain Shintoku]
MATNLKLRFANRLTMILAYGLTHYTCINGFASMRLNQRHESGQRNTGRLSYTFDPFIKLNYLDLQVCYQLI